MAGNFVTAFKISPLACFSVATFFCTCIQIPYGHHKGDGGGDANIRGDRKEKPKETLNKEKLKTGLRKMKVKHGPAV